MRQKSWDICCRIVDNYGDIGVTWRLARQLAAEHGKSVRLWVDDPQTASKLIPGLDPNVASQHMLDVEICHWAGTDSAIPADVVIEAFACELPPAYLEKMTERPPIWVNLEYLSAESWVEDFHAQQSRHPLLPLTRHFFFPGFMPGTGSLLREQGLLHKRDEFRNSAQAQQDFRERFNIPDSDALKVSLFCYPHVPVTDLLKAFAAQPQPVVCMVPESAIWASIEEFAGAELSQGQAICRGNLTLLPLPFMTQDEYDQLLWLCDINFVRGEDSWVRAIWAGKPMIWQPYRQQENTHLEKLAAFLTLYSVGSNPTASAAIRQSHQSWSNETFPEQAWRDYLNHLPAIKQHAAAFSSKLAEQLDLASKLVIFCGNA